MPLTSMLLLGVLAACHLVARKFVIRPGAVKGACDKVAHMGDIGFVLVKVRLQASELRCPRRAAQPLARPGLGLCLPLCALGEGEQADSAAETRDDRARPVACGDTLHHITDVSIYCDISR